jgi:hypothetical protein
MKPAGDHFEATGIPILPYDDRMNWDPYQTAIIRMKNSCGRLLRTIQVTIPVSDEIHCDMCHMQGGDGTVNLPVDPATGLTGTVDTNLNILMTHDYYSGRDGTTTTGSNLVDSQPVLCAKCHSSNALGVPGLPGLKTVSLAMHGWHNGVDLASDATCYSCHAGEITQCLRTSIGGWDTWAPFPPASPDYAMAGYQEWEIQQEILGSQSQAASRVMEAIIPRVETCTRIQKDTAAYTVPPATTALMPGGRQSFGQTTCSP